MTHLLCFKPFNIFFVQASLTPLADEVAKARQRLIAAKNACEDVSTLILFCSSKVPISFQVPLQCTKPDTGNIRAIENKLEKLEKSTDLLILFSLFDTINLQRC